MEQVRLKIDDKEIGLRQVGDGLYEPKFVEPFIDHSLENSPILYFNNWTKNNIQTFGTNNYFEIQR